MAKKLYDDNNGKKTILQWYESPNQSIHETRQLQDTNISITATQKNNCQTQKNNCQAKKQLLAQKQKLTKLRKENKK